MDVGFPCSNGPDRFFAAGFDGDFGVRLRFGAARLLEDFQQLQGLTGPTRAGRFALRSRTDDRHA
jgi:hypothetical protein